MKKLATILVLVVVSSIGQSVLAATRLPFTSSFESGDFSEWNGGLDSTMTVTSQQATHGTHSVQSVMTFGRITDNYKEFLFGDHPRVGGTPVSATAGAWLRFDSKFDQGFTYGAGGNVHKVMTLNFEDENGRRRYQLIINVYTPTNQYFIEHLKWNEDRSFNRAFPSITQNVGTPAPVRFGQWDRFTLFVKANTPGSANGIVRLWINDRLQAEYTNIPVRENTNYNFNKLLMANYVNGTTTNGTQRWDNFYLGEEPPPERAVRPNPPRLDSVQ